MENVQPCPTCGTRVSGGMAEGLCPACLLQAAIGAPEPEPPIETVPAGKMFGDYEIRGPLGQGGMGIVYAARQISLNRPVALKMVRAPHLASDSELARFRQEAEAAARLDHPNIVPVYEAGERDGVQYFTMKLVEGARSLASDLVNGPMNPRDAARLMLKIARAVHYAHQRGVIHRDIKPANILMDSSGEPQLADFGLAKLLEAAISLTHADRVIGTPQYMSPEQVHGHSRELTTATDIYSLGAVLYETLTGRPPFQSASIHEILRQVAEKEPKAPRSVNSLVDSDLQTICLKCLEKIPTHRYASANDLADDLENWLEVRPIAARPVTGVERLKKWGRRNPLVAGLGAALVVVGFLAVGVLIKDRNDAERRFEEERERVEENRKHLEENRKHQEENLVHILNGYVLEASSIRSGSKEGRRWEALALIEKARKILEDPALPAAEAERVEPRLRNEAIACLSIVGVRPANEWKPRGKITLCPNFSRYAEVLSDGRVVVNSLPGHHELLSLQMKSVTPPTVRFSANGKRMAVLREESDGAGIRLAVWDVSNTKPLREFDSPSGGVFDLSPDGARLVLASGPEIQVVEVATGRFVARNPLGQTPDRLLFSPDGRKIAILRRGNDRVSLIDIETGANLDCGDAVKVRSLSWDAKGRWLAIGGEGQIFVWDTLHPEAKARGVLPAPSGDIFEQVAWHPNGRLLASESDVGSSRVDLQACKLEYSIVSPK